MFSLQDRNYIIAQRKIGNYIADLYNRIAAINCPGSTGQRKMMTSAETLFTQLRGIVGNANFAHLFGLKEFGLAINNLIVVTTCH